LVLRTTTLAAWSVGSLTLIMLWLALLGVGWSIGVVAILWMGTIGVGALVVRRLQGAFIVRAAWTPVEYAAVLITAAIAAAIVFNGTYFPFSRADALGIYRPSALAMWQTGTLEPLIGADSLYRTYPVLVPLLYTFAYQVSGWENEMLAKGLATLLALGCLPAVFLLGAEVGERRVGLAAALLLALTPAFARWASAGYVDLPMATFYTLGALFTLRFWRHGGLLEALVGSVMIGLAAFTKNAGLIGIGLFAGALIGAVFLGANRGARARRAIWALIACALVAAPWYVRNLVGAGFLIPDTAWTDQAERSLRTLAIFVTLPNNFALTGWTMLAGVVLLARRTPLLLWFVVPFFAAWWLFVSYDPRFLLLFTPILCVGAGWWLTGVTRRAPRPIQLAIGALVVVLTVYTLWIAVEYKYAILRAPFMSHADKIALVRETP